MRKKVPRDPFKKRADEIREIARGLFDHAERRRLRKFVADCEKMVSAIPDDTAHLK